MRFPNDEICTAHLHDLHNRPADQCGAAFGIISVVNAASYRTQGTSGSIAASFGEGITTVTASATTRPLPVSLGGVSVTVDGVPAGIFFVSPNQVNYLVPSGLSVGLHSVSTTNSEGKRFNGEYYIGAQAPGVFTRDATGGGPASADYGAGYLALYVTGVDPLTITLADVFLHTSAGNYPAQFVEGMGGGSGRQFLGVVQINFLNVPISGQGAELHVGGYVSQGFTLVRP
jgi:uncharacterized protein (TIGR03437 family)